MRRHLVVSFLVVSLVLVGACSESDPPERTGEASAEAPDGEPAPEGIDGVVVVRAASRNHVQGSVDYDTYPPTGGDHFQVWQNCKAYDEPVTDEMAVHSLEHGAVWIAYQDDLPAAQVEAIHDLADADTHILASPYPGLRAPIVMTAWERQLDLDSLDDERFDQFIDTYLQGPTAPERGVTCSGGSDETAD